jgi:hypothetical protein
MPKGPEGRGGGGRSDGGGGDGDGGGGDGVPLAACSRRSSIGDSAKECMWKSRNSSGKFARKDISS